MISYVPKSRYDQPAGFGYHQISVSLVADKSQGKKSPPAPATTFLLPPRNHLICAIVTALSGVFITSVRSALL